MKFDPTAQGAESLVLRNLERVEVAYLRAVRDGSANPVILLLDLLHPCGRAIAEDAGRGPEAAAFVAEVATREGVTPILAWGVPRSQARVSLRRAIPGMADVLDQACSAGNYRVAAVAAGGSAVCELRIGPAW
ncbi:MAG: hypothetical protein JWN86_1677 [Planctomycetota bacterium]|nr:hypothetical protein [Planctomycetota bacterium]